MFVYALRYNPRKLALGAEVKPLRSTYTSKTLLRRAARVQGWNLDEFEIFAIKVG